MSFSKLLRNVFVVSYRPVKDKDPVVFGTFDRLKDALYTVPILLDWYVADVFEIRYIDSRGNSPLIFFWDRSLYGDK